MISIIIPVYNTEKYLGRCIDSILKSGYKDYEIILINDGSTDQSARICRQYCEKDHRIRFTDRGHEGVSQARNAGISASRREWIIFVDSDDRISGDFLGIVGSGKYQDQDLLIFDYAKPGTRRGRSGDRPVRFYGEKDRTELVRCLLEAGQLVKGRNTSLLSPCAKAYKKAVIEQYHLRFSPDISIGEDRLFNIEYFMKIRSCAYIPKTVYQVEARPDSAMRGVHPDYLSNDLRYQKQLKAILVRNNILPLVKKEYYNSVLTGMADVLVRGIFNPHSMADDREKRELCRRMQKCGIYRKALKYNAATGVLPRRVLLWSWGQGYYGISELICRLSYRILEKSKRL